MTVEAWEPPYVGYLDPAQELETIELGDRVGWDLVQMMMATATRPEDREWSVKLLLLGQVCDRYRRDRGVDDVSGLVPSEWMPSPL